MKDIVERAAKYLTSNWPDGESEMTTLIERLRWGNCDHPEIYKEAADEIERLQKLADERLEQMQLDRAQALRWRDELAACQMELTNARADERQAMSYLSEVRAMVGGQDFPEMVRRVRALKLEGVQMSLIEAAKQALEALELADYHLTPNINLAAKMQKPIVHLRTAIKQAEKVEPVGWVTDSGYGAVLTSNHGLDDGTPLYAHLATIKDCLTVQNPVTWTLFWAEEGGIQDQMFATEQEAIACVKQYAPEDQVQIVVQPLYTHPAPAAPEVKK